LFNLSIICAEHRAEHRHKEIGMDTRKHAERDPRAFEGEERTEMGEQMRTTQDHWNARVQALTQQISGLQQGHDRDRSEGIV
jgi:hypothetical protein